MKKTILLLIFILALASCAVPMVEVIAEPIPQIMPVSAVKVQQNDWTNKNLVLFGDSITWYDGRLFGKGHNEHGENAKAWSSYVKDYFDCNIENNALSGRNIVENWNEVIRDYDFSGDIDAVIIMSGANDHREGIKPDTYQYIYQIIIEKIERENSDIQIYLLTPIRGWFTQNKTDSVPDAYNGEMEISREYVNALMEIGDMYDIPVCNLYDGVPITEDNMHTYLGDHAKCAYFLHPTNYCYEVMADEIIPFLEKR